MKREDRRIWLCSSLLVVALLTLGGVLLRGYVARSLEAETRVQIAFLDLALRDRARFLAESLQPTANGIGWPANLSDVLTRNHADFNRDIFLQLFEPDGRLVASSANAPVSLGLAAITRRDGLRDLRWLTEPATDASGRALRLVTYPVYVGDPTAPGTRVLGFAQAGLPLPDPASAIDRISRIMAAGLAIVGATLMVASWLAIRSTSRRFARQSAEIHAAQLRFIGDAAHELGTPLAILQGEIDIALRRERSPEEYRGALASCREEIERLSRLSENLLVLATADAGQEPLRPGPCDAAAIARKVHSRFLHVATEKKVNFTVTTPETLPWTSDVLSMEQVLGNLISNAIRHTPAGESVELRAVREADEILFSVSDTGEGIPPLHLPRLFERFHRVDRARSRSSGGAGLGLAIVRSLVTALGGSVEVRSHLGKGSTFTCRFPTTPPHSKKN
jgi:signal transduction histidine kinase